jgi:uncharacterized membrane-anchored protein YitT (DUF2179 family)
LVWNYEAGVTSSPGPLTNTKVVGFVLEKGKGGETVKRILMFLAVALVMIAIVVAMAAPAFAAPQRGCQGISTADQAGAAPPAHPKGPPLTVFSPAFDC